ncbi:MAG: hypothetical protein ACJ71W_04665 [Terriglobales bacterium]
MKIVLTIHGVGFLGGKGDDWQKAVAKVIGPHFCCEPVSYRHYRWLGLLSAVIDPSVIVVGIVAAPYWRHLIGAPLWVLLVMVMGAGVGGAYIRRKVCAKSFIAQLSSQPYRYRGSHVIAHSMGTHMIGAAIAEGAVPLDAIILMGSVLAPDYPWHEYSVKFERVRNEVGKKDIVPLLAEILNRLWLLRGFGMSGRRGFTERPYFIHTVKDPDIQCPDCTPEQVAPIHNIICPSGHSGTLDAAHAAFYWLPFLWEIDTFEYSRWLRFCSHAAAHYEKRRWRKLRIVEDELLASKWRWTNMQTVEEYIASVVRTDQRRVSFAVKGEVLRRTYLAVRAGLDVHQSLDKPFDQQWNTALAWLNPEVAVRYAVDKTLQAT